jgi:hypothetical protein
VIVKEARRRGILVRRLNSHSLVQLGLGRNLRRIRAMVCDRTSSIAVDIVQNRDEAKRVLGNIGLPVAGGDVVRTVEAAELDAKAGMTPESSAVTPPRRVATTQRDRRHQVRREREGDLMPFAHTIARAWAARLPGPDLAGYQK